jgi:predicted CoA-binding protein
MQLGIRSPVARQALEEAGITVVENQCTKIEHARLNRMGLL